MRITPFALLLLPATTFGQALDPARVHELAQELLVPIHTQPDDPDGGAYGIWAAGPSYKVSFHDGFAFYPHLGPEAPRHLPLHWRTESVTVGGVDFPMEARRESYAGQRFERVCRDLIEAYEVRRDGVEQTFTLLEEPEGRGALTITGRVTTPLHAPVTGPRHGEIVFSEDGRPVVRYGSAVAIDAAGRRWPLETGYDGACIRICVPADVVAEASYPLLVDPLTSTVVINTGSNYLERPSIAASTEIVNSRVVVAWYRNPTANDFDVYAIKADLGFQSSTWLYQDVTTSWSTPVVDVAYVAFGPAWVLALQRDFSATKAVRAYVHDDANTTMNGGTTLFVAQPAGTEQIRPAIGGSMGTNSALLVFDRFDTATQFNFSWGTLVDISPPSLGTSFRFDAGFLVETFRPSVTPIRSGSPGWIVALSEDTEVRVAQVTTTPPSSVVSTVVLATLSSGSEVTHTQIAGSNGRFLLTCRSTFLAPGVPFPRYYVSVIRFDWTIVGSPTVIRMHTLPIFSVTGDLHLGGCAYDEVTRSHWAFAYEIDNVHTVARCGYTGGITESQNLAGPIDVTYTRPNRLGIFPIAYAQISISGISIRARELRYPTDAISATYGSSCAPGTSIETPPSYAGHEFYGESLHGIPAGAPAIYVLSGFTDHFDLGTIGLFGCWLNVLLPAITLTANANAGGIAAVTYSLPDDPPFIGDVYSQWLFIDASQPQPVRAAHGTRHQVR